MPLGHADPGDEHFTLAGTDYHFRFPESGGGFGLGSASPFAPKSTSGERSYQDYDVFSAVALADLSGGMGQERLTDVTRYLTAVDADVRSGRIILGPEQFALSFGLDALGPNVTLSTTRKFPYATEPSSVPCSWVAMGDGAPTQLAQFLTVVGSRPVDRLWLPLRRDEGFDAAEIFVSIVESINDSPIGVYVAGATLTASAISTVGGWTECALDSSLATLSSDYQYWITVSYTASAPGRFYWLGQDALTQPSGNVQEYSGSWALNTAYDDLMYWVEGSDGLSVPDAPPHFFAGTGKDGRRRVWYWAGRYLRYIENDGVHYPAKTGAATKRLPLDITSAVFFAGSGDGGIAHIYVALGSGSAVQKYDADVLGSNVWATPAGAPTANLLVVHDGKLWRSLNTNEVSGSLDGATYGDPVTVGDKAYSIRNLLDWDGALWVGKDDGLYKVTFSSGYPTSGVPICVRVLSLASQLDDDNFRLMVEHQNDLWFSVGQGLMKLTTGNVLTSVAPELSLGYNQANRTSYTAAYSALSTLWVAAEANIDGTAPDAMTVASSSYILAYFEGKWHPITTLTRPGDMIRSLLSDGGIYGATPRLYYGAGLTTTFMEIPTTTQKRWLWDGVTYNTRGILYTSWIDGNLRTIEKDWVQLDLDCLNMTAAEYIKVWWRSSEGGYWQLVGTVTAEGVTHLTFPAASHSVQCQLGIELKRLEAAGDSDEAATPQVLAVVLKYLERPRDVRSFTRTYELSTRAHWRTGAPVQLSLAEQVAQLETLRESAEPLTWTSWWGGTYTVHITGYNGTELPERTSDLQDEGSITVVVQLQECA